MQLAFVLMGPHDKTVLSVLMEQFEELPDQTKIKTIYNGHKRVNAMKFQSFVVPNGLIANLSGPFEGKLHDSTMLYQCGLLQSAEQPLIS